MTGPLTPITVRRLASLAFVLACAMPAVAQTADVSYPPSRSLGDIAAWLMRDTPLQPAQIVDVSPQAVTAITSASPMGQTRGFLANIASEAVDPAMLAHDGIASWSIPVEIDCDRRTVRLGTMSGFRGRDLASEPRIVREADATWVNPSPSAPLGSVIRALCDRDFHRPLVGRLKIAKGPEPKSGPPPVVEVRPKKVVEAAAKPAADGAMPAIRGPRAPLSIPIPGVSSPVVGSAATAPAAGAKLKPPAGGGPVALQIGASPSLPDIQGLMTRFKVKFGTGLGGLKIGVATVQVDGKTVNRALVSGFATPAEANAFCKTLADAGQACFIRR